VIMARVRAERSICPPPCEPSSWMAFMRWVWVNRRRRIRP
jgi:hypothetical protein